MEARQGRRSILSGRIGVFAMHGKFRRASDHLLLLCGPAWLALIAASFVWNWFRVGNSMLVLAESEARSSFEKDLAYRDWAPSPGGVYAPPTEASPPNPYLEYLPNRDVETTADQRLTSVEATNR